ncbi:MAG: formylglycine-generating enzyme family protein [Anaerolineae bacterium]|nr:formylglycine-generating enzyme family protein [Anaerolineae bacterium]
MGLSDKQKAIIRQRIRVHYNVEQLDAPTQYLIEEVKEKFRLYAATKTPKEIIQGSGPELSTTEQAIRQRFKYLLTVEAMLRRVQQRAVKLSTFYIARFPITKEQWAQHLGWRAPRDPKLPAAANWYAADRFSHEFGTRLPTEAEWEKAARGTTGWLYPWGDDWDPTRGNFLKDPTAPGHVSGTWMSLVDAYPSGVSPYGVWDMCGNVQEWTMTVKWSPYNEDESVVKKSWPVKYDSEIPWYDHLLCKRGVGGREDAFYTGLRPVLDEWVRQHWRGFTTGENEEQQDPSPKDGK